jgi:hypothetical protein
VDTSPEVFCRFDLREWKPDLYNRFIKALREIGGRLETSEGRPCLWTRALSSMFCGPRQQRASLRMLVLFSTHKPKPVAGGIDSGAVHQPLQPTSGAQIEVE